MEEILDYIPPVPNCMICDREIDGFVYGKIECLEQNGGLEWWAYCPLCDVQTFSQTFSIKATEERDGLGDEAHRAIDDRRNSTFSPSW